MFCKVSIGLFLLVAYWCIFISSPFPFYLSKFQGSWGTVIKVAIGAPFANRLPR